jgi:hypothetical protein
MDRRTSTRVCILRFQPRSVVVDSLPRIELDGNDGRFEFLNKTKWIKYQKKKVEDAVAKTLNVNAPRTTGNGIEKK